MSSKLGIHINDWMLGVIEWVIQYQPAWIKVLDHQGDSVRACLDGSPESQFIGRMHKTPSEQNDLIAAKESGAEQFFRELEARGTWNLIKIWEGLNEIGPHPTADHYRFCVRLADLLAAAGKDYAYGNWSVGCPEISDWQSEWMLEPIRRAAYIAVHEYCAPSMDAEFIIHANDPDIQPEVGGYFTLRYRKWYPTLPPDCQKPILITECGIDSGAAHWKPGSQGGWQSFTDVKGYMAQLAWYDGFLQEDDEVAGATPFCWSVHDPTFETFSLWEPPEAREAFAAYIISQQDGGNGGDWAYEMRKLLEQNLRLGQELLNLFMNPPPVPPVPEAVALIEQGQDTITEGVALLK